MGLPGAFQVVLEYVCSGVGCWLFCMVVWWYNYCLSLNTGVLFIRRVGWAGLVRGGCVRCGW